MAEIQYGYLKDPAVQGFLPAVSQALKTDSALSGLRNAAANALRRARGIKPVEAYEEVDTALFTSEDNVSKARKILNAIVRPEGSREAPGFVAVGVEGDEEQAPGAMIAVEATQERGLAERGAASIFGDASNESIADAYEDLFGVSPF